MPTAPKVAPRTPQQKPELESDSDDAIASSTPMFGVTPTPSKAETPTHNPKKGDPTKETTAGAPATEIAPVIATKQQSPPSTPPAPAPVPVAMHSPDRPAHSDTGFQDASSSQPPPLPFSAVGVVKSLMAAPSAPAQATAAAASDVRQLVLSDSNLLNIEGLELERFTSLQLANFAFNHIKTVAPISSSSLMSLTNLTGEKGLGASVLPDIIAANLFYLVTSLLSQYWTFPITSSRTLTGSRTSLNCKFSEPTATRLTTSRTSPSPTFRS